ncbi:GNAT family N-acetyltransferase [Streptomyces sp. KLOTTS4A1]|uniref:GNAT family N-acetyltransferase n=1 Tax=Streptomyces sp. KLOTTS4A1 TaxID=3390996 RepID=UPI0039F4A58E
MSLLEAPVTSGLTVSVCRDPEEFHALADAWDRLHARCGAATPFQTHAWLSSWWQAYGRPGRLRVVLVRCGGELVGAAPLMLAHRPLPVLLPIGTGISDFADVIVDDTQAATALPALVEGLERAARRHVVDLREVRPGAAAQRVFEAWRGPRHRTADSLCLELPALDMDGLIGRLATSRAQRARAKLRKLDAAGITARTVTGADEVRRAIGTLLALHALQWQGRGVTQEHLSARFAEHLGRAAASMVAGGHAVVTLYDLDGETVAANLSLRSGQLSGGYLYGVDPRVRARKLDAACLLLREDAEGAVRAGCSVISLLRGDEPYKQHWKPDPVANQRLLLAGAGAGAGALLGVYRAQVEGRRRAVRTVRAQAPALAAWRRRAGAMLARAGTKGGRPAEGEDREG